MCDWIKEAMFYHIYPLGLCGAPHRNEFSSPPVSRLDQLYPWLEHIQQLGLNAIYLGPVFESTAHGYDTADFWQVDRRLGTNETLANFSRAVHAKNMRLILDGVFNHVGRDFWAFRDVLENGSQSLYRDWFYRLDFAGRSPYGDPFSYEGWSGHYDLVKLNLTNPAVKQHIFEAIGSWINDYQIDGLRLDAADNLDQDFIKELAAFCHARKPNFWLMGEMVHGDYRRLANRDGLDSVTNYECYKGLYSSHEDQNYFEIAYALNRQFGEGGLYQNLPLYNFADNHDVNRVASNLSNPAHLYPLYCLLFTMPGVPSVYYGSEWGLKGVRTASDDSGLRPALMLDNLASGCPQPDLPRAIKRLAAVRQGLTALKYGNYRQLYLNHKQLVFSREVGGQRVIVAVNTAGERIPLNLSLPKHYCGHLIDRLNEGETFPVKDGKVTNLNLWANWARVLEYVPAR